jgi:parallel beta-helix repeat protein
MAFSPAGAATYHVAPDGNDKNSGRSWSQAWRTLEYAGRRAVVGDEVIIRKGPAPYGYLPIVNSGKPGKPITFRGERASDPPLITGAVRVTKWAGPDKNGVWKSQNISKVSRLAENNDMVAPASTPACENGRWYWDKDRTLYYRPGAGTPVDHEIWVSKSAGGIIIRDNSWIIIQDLYAWFGLASGVSIKNGHHNVIRNFHAKWYWIGVSISHGSNHNLVENCLVEENREGIYLWYGVSYNTVRGCRTFHNGNAPIWNNGDRGGIAIGTGGPNVGNTVEDCDIAYNGGPDSDPALIAFQSPESLLLRNHVHDNFGSGIFVTISSDRSKVFGNIVERNGMSAVKDKRKNIAGLSVRRSRDVVVENNQVLGNWVSRGDRWGNPDPRGGLDLQGNTNDDMRGIVFRNNEVSGTVSGPDVYISQNPQTSGIVIEPLDQAPWWLKLKGPRSTQPEPPKQ